MGLPTSWTNPSTEEQAVGAIIPAARLNAILGNLLKLGGTTGLVPAAALAVEPWTAFTPGLYQGSNVTVSSALGRYSKIGRLATVWMRLTASSAGTATGLIQIYSVPAVIAPISLNVMVGSFWFMGASRNFGIALFDSSSQLHFFQVGVATGFGVADVTIANTNIIEMVLSYETAS